MRKLKDKEIDEQLRIVSFRASTWGEKERLAGITDRNAWWEGKTLEQAGAELQRLIRERIARGELLDIV